jgi:formylglycine-generating enzyme required for sulfatase activity
LLLACSPESPAPGGQDELAAWAADPALAAQVFAADPDPVRREAALRALGEAHPEALPQICDRLEPGKLQDRCRVIANRPHLLRMLDPPRRRGPAVPSGTHGTTWPGANLADIEIEVVRIEPGTFQMGSPPEEVGRQACETRHQVTLSRPFLLARTELTQRQWTALVGLNPSRWKDCPDCPVETVTWYDALRYCNLLSEVQGLEPVYQLGELRRDARGFERTEVVWNPVASGWRLPTEAEWEYAARAGEPWLYSGSNDVAAVAWHDGNAGGHTHPVATLQANAWGLFDMSANVFEWCWDAYGDFSAQAVVDPLGPPGLDGNRVSRGGSWYDIPRRVRVADRFGDEPDYANDTMGFRLARSAP